MEDISCSQLVDLPNDDNELQADSINPFSHYDDKFVDPVDGYPEIPNDRIHLMKKHSPNDSLKDETALRLSKKGIRCQICFQNFNSFSLLKKHVLSCTSKPISSSFTQSRNNCLADKQNCAKNEGQPASQLKANLKVYLGSSNTKNATVSDSSKQHLDFPSCEEYVDENNQVIKERSVYDPFSVSNSSHLDNQNVLEQTKHISEDIYMFVNEAAVSKYSEITLGNYKCDFCHKRFFSYDKLKKHVPTHTIGRLKARVCRTAITLILYLFWRALWQDG